MIRVIVLWLGVTCSAIAHELPQTALSRFVPSVGLVIAWPSDDHTRLNCNVLREHSDWRNLAGWIDETLGQELSDDDKRLCVESVDVQFEVEGWVTLCSLSSIRNNTCWQAGFAADGTPCDYAVGDTVLVNGEWHPGVIENVDGQWRLVKGHTPDYSSVRWGYAQCEPRYY